MLIHRQNSYAPCSKRRTGRREAQSGGSGPHTKNPPCIWSLHLCWDVRPHCPMYFNGHSIHFNLFIPLLSYVLFLMWPFVWVFLNSIVCTESYLYIGVFEQICDLFDFFVEAYESELISFYYFCLLHFYSSVGLSYCIICFVDGCRFSTDSYVVYIFCLISLSLFSDMLDMCLPNRIANGWHSVFCGMAWPVSYYCDGCSVFKINYIHTFLICYYMYDNIYEGHFNCFFLMANV
jgi:hypothetical protein